MNKRKNSHRNASAKVDPGGIPTNVDLGLAEGTPISSDDSPLKSYKDIFDSIPEPAVVLDLDGRILDVNKKFLFATETAREDLVGSLMSEFTSNLANEDGSGVASAIKKSIITSIQKDRTVYDLEIVFTNKKGKDTKYSLTAAPIKNGDGNVVGVMGLGRDMDYVRKLKNKLEAANATIGEYKESIDAKLGDRLDEMDQRARILEELSITDELTKLLNRRYLFKRVAEEMQRTKRYGTPFSAIMLDIDFFKQVNDTYGHQAGDMVLYELAGILRGSVRQVDVVARTGGEEFVIILPSVREGHAFLFCERLREKVAAFQFTALPEDRSLHISLGITDFPRENVDSVDDLIQLADMALYKAKETRNTTISSSNLSPEDLIKD